MTRPIPQCTRCGGAGHTLSNCHWPTGDMAAALNTPAGERNTMTHCTPEEARMFAQCIQNRTPFSSDLMAKALRSLADQLEQAAPVVPAPVASTQEIVWPETCDGKEQEAWEAYGQGAKLDMSRHPMFYIFLAPETDAARYAWKAGLAYATKVIRDQMDSTPPQAAPVAQLSELPDGWLSHGWVYQTNNTYTHFSKDQPPDDAYDKGTCIQVFAKAGGTSGFELLDAQSMEQSK